jgi:hypothetical protein
MSIFKLRFNESRDLLKRNYDYTNFQRVITNLPNNFFEEPYKLMVTRACKARHSTEATMTPDDDPWNPKVQRHSAISESHDYGKLEKYKEPPVPYFSSLIFLKTMRTNGKNHPSNNLLNNNINGILKTSLPLSTMWTQNVTITNELLKGDN